MGRFSRAKKPVHVVNMAGGAAHAENPRLELVGIALTSFMDDQFYRTAGAVQTRLEQLIALDPEFAARTAVYARHTFGMRSVSHYIAAVLGRVASGQPWLKGFFTRIVRRPDDMTEIVAAFGHKYGLPLPNAMRRGFAEAFNKFDAYGLAKYREQGNEVKLVDVVNLVHPAPESGKKAAMKALMKGTLAPADTWEVALTRAGSDPAAKGAAWNELVLGGKLPYFALLRNLRNIETYCARTAFEDALRQLVDPDAIKKSLVLPFRFMSAYEQVSHIATKAALEQAATIALSNLPEWPGRTCVMLDTSGSMQGKPLDVGSLFAAVMVAKNNATLVTFSDGASLFQRRGVNVPILALTKEIKDSARMAGTNFHAPFESIRRAKMPFDRIVLLSDMQGWMTQPDNYYMTASPKQAFAAYKREQNVNPFVFSFNLNDYGSLMIPEDKVFALAGWSDKALELMAVLETDKNALVHAVEATSLCVVAEAVATSPKRKRVGSNPTRRAISQKSSTQTGRISGRSRNITAQVREARLIKP